MHCKGPFSTLLLLLAFHLLLPRASCRSWRVGDECPSIIKVQIPNDRYYGDGPEPLSLGTMASVHAALSNCSNITSLDLRVSLQGCSDWPDRWSFPFSPSGGETYPALKRLRLEGYDFSDRFMDEVGWWGSHNHLPWYETALDWVFSGNAFQFLGAYSLPKEQREKNNIQLWVDAMDWSQVEEFALLGHQLPDSMQSFLNSTMGLFTGLRRLELEGRRPVTIVQILVNLEPHSLTHFTSTNSFNINLLSALKELQGQSLQHLDLHTVETTLVPSLVYSADQLEILKHMPNLTHLALNVARNGTWPFEVLSAVSQIPSLRTAELWLDITSMCRKQKVDRGYHNIEDPVCAGKNQYLQLFINETSARDVFKYLRANKSGEELSNVTFWAGDWSRAWDGPLYQPPWIEGRKAKVFCTTVKEGPRLGEEECTVLAGIEYWDHKGRWNEDLDEIWLDDSDASW